MSKASLILVVPYVHVLGLVLAHVAVITLSDAPINIASYNLTFFSRYLLLSLVFCIICYYLRRLSLDFTIIATIIIIYLFIFNHSVLCQPCNSLCAASFEH